ncbi:hypothetical protein AXF42_Ash008088 [Apostasia shenzhenica]|uniref:Uncharacterized protein n=1 Tax=Apostasia shenzhenica TaxID=1088818 RepID=A0A2I0A8I1_9ASPA|nr:hypothetical protein AXF42_Ash008088 [Apostasia shenzhenica]
MNTMDRHGSRERPDLQDLMPKSLETAPVVSNELIEKLEKEYPKKVTLEKEKITNISDASTDLNEEMKSIKISNPLSGILHVNGVSHGHLVGDARDFAISGASVSGLINGNHKAFTSTSEAGNLTYRKPYHAPHLFFVPKNETRRDLKLDRIISANSDTSYSFSTQNEESRDNDRPESSNSCMLEISQCEHHTMEENEGGSIKRPPGALIDLSDLSGDYEMHLSSLVYAQWCQEQMIGTYFVPFHRSASFPYRHGKDVWSRGGMFAHLNVDGLSPKFSFSPIACYPITLAGKSGNGDVPKTRGTGTYFPNTNYSAYKERNSLEKVKNPVTRNPISRALNNGHTDTPQDMNKMDKVSPGVRAAPMISGNGRERTPRLPDIIPQSPLPLALKSSSHTNGFALPSHRFEFGSLGPLSTRSLMQERDRKSDSAPYHGQSSGITGIPSLRRTIVNSNSEWNSQSYQLKDDNDFPPLSADRC